MPCSRAASCPSPASRSRYVYTYFSGWFDPVRQLGPVGDSLGMVMPGMPHIIPGSSPHKEQFVPCRVAPTAPCNSGALANESPASPLNKLPPSTTIWGCGCF